MNHAGVALQFANICLSISKNCVTIQCGEVQDILSSGKQQKADTHAHRAGLPQQQNASLVINGCVAARHTRA
jgi:hypothetical protein